MNLGIVRASLLGLSVAAIAASASAALAPVGDAAPPAARRPSPGDATGPGESVVADSVAALAIGRAPFRVSRRPAPVAYDPSRVPDAASPLPAPPAAKPTLSLSGIVWGVEPAAVIEGFPGTESSRVVRRGDVVGDFRVKRIEPTRVVIAGLDTTWHLTMRQPWR